MLPQCSVAVFIVFTYHPSSGLIARSSLRPFYGAVHKPRVNQIGVLCSGFQEHGGNDDDCHNDNDNDKNTNRIQQQSQPQLQQNQQQLSQQQQPGKIKSKNNNKDQSLTRVLSLMGTSPRRIFLSLASSSTIALTANLFGITSNLLSVLPEELAEKSGLDSVYPRGDYKRVVVRATSGMNALGVASNRSNSGKCSFLIPKEWVADTGLALAQAQRQARALDYSMPSPSSSERRQQANVLPDAAYGPPGSGGDTNVSVIINANVRDFRLSSLGNGDPTSAAEFLLSNRPRPATLVSATEERRAGDAVYRFEYTVDRGERARPLRAISVVAGSQEGDAFVTLTVVSTEDEWKRPLVGDGLRRVVGSFKLV